MKGNVIIILTKFLKESLKKVRNAGIPDSDKIRNFMESLEPYHLEKYLKNYYTAKQILEHFRDRLTADQLPKVKHLAHPEPLQSAHLFVVNKDQIRPVNDHDVDRALQTTLEILKRSDQ